MEKVVLIGWNIEHSLSPAIHNFLFDKYDLPLQYELLDLTREEVVPTLRTLKRGGYRGANVTSPYKQTVLIELDNLSEEAETIGAVNTIVFDHGRGIGHNTDSYGFAWSLTGEPLLERELTAAVLGTGGAAMAAIFHLLRLPTVTSITLYSRDCARAEHVVAGWNDPRLHPAALADFAPADLVVHATPVGMPGTPGQLLTADQLGGVKLLYEMIYSPSETPLTRDAREAGARVLTGSQMLLGQAARAFYLWTGIEVEPSDLPTGIFSELDNAL
jgi:shikimate dehydrogenase